MHDVHQYDETALGIMHKRGGPWTLMGIRYRPETYVDYDTFEGAAAHYLILQGIHT